MGRIASHRTLRCRVALKLIDARYLQHRESLARFAREARTAAALRSPHIVQILDFGADEGTPYIVMELLRGRSLAEELDLRGRLRPAEVFEIMRQLCKAITLAHDSQIVHRDLKPGNIFLARDEDGWILKVLDFGIAKALDREDTYSGIIRTQTGVLLGTPLYVSPEQAVGRNVDKRTDLWAMAILAFECLTGTLPLRGTTPAEVLRELTKGSLIVPSLVASVPPNFDEWFARATARHPEHRFQSARAMVSSLRTVLLGNNADLGQARDSKQPGAASLGEPPHAVAPGSPTRATLRERRREVRTVARIPAGVDGLRDLGHLALVHDISFAGALLCARSPCHVGQELTLSLRTAGLDACVAGRVVRVEPAPLDRASLWRCDVAIEFRDPLPSAWFRALAQRSGAERAHG